MLISSLIASSDLNVPWLWSAHNAYPHLLSSVSLILAAPTFEYWENVHPYLSPDQWPNIISKITLISIFFLLPSAVPWWICDKSSEKPSQKGEILGWRPDCFHSLWDIKGRYFKKRWSKNLLFGSCNRTLVCFCKGWMQTV